MKRSNIFWGILLILAAALLLLKQFNIIQSFFSYFWILALLLLGVWLIFSALTRKHNQPGEPVSVSLEGAASARLKLDYGAGNLVIGAGAAPGLLLQGECSPPPLVRTQSEGDRLVARLRSTPEFWMWVPGESRDWKLSLAKEVPIELDIDSGASNSTIDLTDLKVSLLDLDTGASSCALTLPANAGFTRVKVDSGMATVRVRIPAGVAARIRIESGLATVNVDSRFPKLDGKLYQSPDYETAANRAEISMEAGMATLEIK